MPSTSDITATVLSGKGVARHTNSLYFLGPPLCGRESDEDVIRAVKLIHLVRDTCEEYYNVQLSRRTNYEDYYYVLSQIYDSELGEFDNPAVQSLVDELRPQIEQILLEESSSGIRPPKYLNLLQEGINYIEDTATNMLLHQPTDLDDHLLFLYQGIEEGLSIDVFTLNNDTILEQTLSRTGFVFVDGFGDEISGLRYWQPDLFDTMSAPIRLFKLHGSVDWFLVTPDDGGPSRLAQFRNQDRYHLVGPSGELMLANPPRPLLLMGTFNKMLSYTAGLYGDLHCNFHHSLSQNSVMIICGYGFRDKGINTKIAQWVTANQERRLVVVHPRPTNLIAQARGVIANNWESWQRRDQLRIIEASVHDIAWEDIRSQII